MPKTIYLLLTLAFAAPAAAQFDPPGTGNYFLVGTDEQHLLWRAVADVARYEFFGGNYCYTIVSGGTSTTHCGDVDETCFAAPYTGPCGTVPATGAKIPHAWEIYTPGDATVKCMENGPYPALHPLYEQQTRTLDVGSVTIPALTPYESIPQSCKDALIYNYCGPVPGFWAEQMCGWGFLYCCA